MQAATFFCFLVLIAAAYWTTTTNAKLLHQWFHIKCKDVFVETSATYDNLPAAMTACVNVTDCLGIFKNYSNSEYLTISRVFGLAQNPPSSGIYYLKDFTNGTNDVNAPSDTDNKLFQLIYHGGVSENCPLGYFDFKNGQCRVGALFMEESMGKCLLYPAYMQPQLLGAHNAWCTIRSKSAVISSWQQDNNKQELK